MTIPRDDTDDLEITLYGTRPDLPARATPARPTEIIRRSRLEKGYGAMAFVGALLVVTQIVLNIFPPHFVINPWAMLTSAAFAFWGFNGRDPKSTTKASEFLSGTAERIIVAVRTGRRKSDAIVAVATTTHPPEVAAVIDAPADLPETGDHGDTGSRKARPRDTMGEAGE